VLDSTQPRSVSGWNDMTIKQRTVVCGALFLDLAPFIFGFAFSCVFSGAFSWAVVGCLGFRCARRAGGLP
jgi:hypothetical protein